MPRQTPVPASFLKTAKSFGRSGFTTKDFRDRFKLQHPKEWQSFVDEYGEGGRQSGSFYSANSRVASKLAVMFRRGELHRFKYESSPPDWGNRWIRRWAVSPDGGLADALVLEGATEDEAAAAPPAWADHEYFEGTPKLRAHLRRERDPAMPQHKKAAFIAEHGKLFCEHCRFDPSEDYGEHSDAVIEVHHHAVQVANMNPGHKVKLADLQCLCANCHRVVHAAIRAQSKVPAPS